nr:hypothetical protein [Bradyrhizobium vignae]
MTRDGHFDAARRATEELNAQISFHQADLSAERRLLDIKALRCAGDMSFLGNRNEISEAT